MKVQWVCQKCKRLIMSGLVSFCFFEKIKSVRYRTDFVRKWNEFFSWMCLKYRSILYLEDEIHSLQNLMFRIHFYKKIKFISFRKI